MVMVLVFDSATRVLAASRRRRWRVVPVGMVVLTVRVAVAREVLVVFSVVWAVLFIVIAVFASGLLLSPTVLAPIAEFVPVSEVKSVFVRMAILSTSRCTGGRLIRYTCL